MSLAVGKQGKSSPRPGRFITKTKERRFGYIVLSARSSGTDSALHSFVRRLFTPEW
jgi:hypothetical protein